MSRDYFTEEIIQRALVAIGEEMFQALRRTSMSPIIYETLDYAVGVTDARANLIAQGNGVIGFLGTLDAAVRAVLAKFPSEIHPGDIFITNDPYGGGGSHLSDVTLVQPVFDDDVLVAFVVNKAHWTEVGGMHAGSYTTAATEVYQEGLQFPTVKLFRCGVADQGLIDLIASNVRLPKMTLGDMWAGIAANRVGARRITQLVQRYGRDLVQHAIAALLDYGERMVRAELARLPAGSYSAEDWIDSDGLGSDPIKVAVRVTIDADSFTLDYSGTARQTRGPINLSRVGLESRARAIFRAVTAPHLPTNGGMFRPLKVVCPEGTVFTATRPAPTSLYFESGAYAVDLVWKALAPHMPERLPAGCFLSICGTIIAGDHPETGEPYLLVEPLLGGWGAGHDKDGENGQFAQSNGETYNIPIEVTETRYGVTVEQYAFHNERGGAGCRRGGKGVVLDYRLRSHGHLTGIYGRHKHPCWGIAGGASGSPNAAWVVRRDGAEECLHTAARVPLAAGDMVRLVTGTGGGFGNPLDRPRSAVRDDLLNGYITADEARQDYGLMEPVAKCTSGAGEGP